MLHLPSTTSPPSKLFSKARLPYAYITAYSTAPPVRGGMCVLCIWSKSRLSDKYGSRVAIPGRWKNIAVFHFLLGRLARRRRSRHHLSTSNHKGQQKAAWNSDVMVERARSDDVGWGCYGRNTFTYIFKLGFFFFFCETTPWADHSIYTAFSESQR